MRPIMFSTVFPKYHPKAGELTYFVEKIWKSLWELSSFQAMGAYERRYNEVFPVLYAPEENIHFHQPKYHTIRSGNRWKVGDLFSPRVWSGIAYRSPQIIIGQPIKVERIWPFVISECEYFLDGRCIGLTELSKIARNDGLDVQDMEDWFAPFGKKGQEECQIICWNHKIEY